MHKLREKIFKVTEQYNKTPHSVTSFSPNYLLFGIQSKCKIDSNMSLKKARQISFENSQKAHDRNKLYYDKKHQKFEFRENDLVLVENKNEISRRKLERIMIGPYKIVKKL